MSTEFLKPGEGRKPRHPVTNRNIAATGETLELSIHVLRMIDDGDLVKASQPKAKPAAKKGAKK